MATPHDAPPSVTSPVGRAAESLYWAMAGLEGPEATGWTGELGLPTAPREERPKALILGGGVAGLTAAYELSLRGYRCTVLEAWRRVGGRNRTARRGDELYELDARGELVRTHLCDFDEDLYLNLGPGRIPHHHRRVLEYCTELEVDLQPYIMETTANVVRLGGEPGYRWRNNRVANDTRGYLAARLAALEPDLWPDLRDLLITFGDLNRDTLTYEGSTRSGYLHDLDIHEFPRPAPPIPFGNLLASNFWKEHFYQPTAYLWQATMFQPVGGMDQVVTALADAARAAGAVIELEAEVTGITVRDRQDVTVTYMQGGREAGSSRRPRPTA
ncbi:FAD-dependent oxidoreductase [Streptomyces triculaminicus]|uniref:flavin monoamine oxidase family protein n=1 Tax=Streptomyces triculaminicus TaxID=2816232 RepID=UPI0033E7B0A5